MKKEKKSISYGKWGQIFILPFFIIYFIFSLIPLADTSDTVFMNTPFRNWEVGPNFVGNGKLYQSAEIRYAGIWKKHADSVADQFLSRRL